MRLTRGSLRVYKPSIVLPARLAAVLATILLCGLSSVSAAKNETWVEVRSPNFRVITDAGQKKGEQVAVQLETIRAVFRQALVFAAEHPTPTITVLAAKDEKSLSQLLPEYWAVKGHSHPAGIFYGGLNRTYIELRTDATGLENYGTIYHEYYHSLSMPYFPGLPLWLSEGMAEFFGHTEVLGKETKIGEADANLLTLLQQEKLLSIPALMRVDQSSPYYNEENKTTIFYAESWALIHYLMLGDNASHQKQLSSFLDRVGKGEPQEQAARETLGDLKQLQKRLDDYVTRHAYMVLTMKTPEIDSRNFPARELTEAESDAVRGDAFVARRRPADAQPLLEQALKLDPNSAAAAAGMGLLNFAEGHRDQASMWFSKAIDLNSQDYLVYYYRAMVKSAGHLMDEESISQDESDLRKCIALNPDFAYAYSSLAVVEANEENWPDAVTMAKKAVELEPGSATVEVNVASAYLRMNRVAEAMGAARLAQLAARNPEEHAEADSMVRSISQMQSVAGSSSTPGSNGFPEARPQPIDATGTVADNSASAGEATDESAAGLKLLARAEGTIANVACNQLQMTLEIDHDGQNIELHSANLTQVRYIAAGNWKPPNPFSPCLNLKGLHASVAYVPSHDGSKDGEIVRIEMQPPQ
jgi:tetratricopeptide (TPR) repeat protein